MSLTNPEIREFSVLGAQNAEAKETVLVLPGMQGYINTAITRNIIFVVEYEMAWAVGVVDLRDMTITKADGTPCAKNFQDHVGDIMKGLTCKDCSESVEKVGQTEFPPPTIIPDTNFEPRTRRCN